LSGLRIISLLLEKTIVTDNTNTMDKLKTRKESLINETTYIKEQIQKIEETFPYCIKDLLLNKDDLQNKINEYSDLLTELQEQNENIEKRLESMLK
jgi:predicted transcriptional regulator